jgi:hypothetical protein
VKWLPVACVLWLAVLASSARAASVAITLPPAPPSEDAAFAVSFTGDTTGLDGDTGYLYARYRPSGGSACAPTYSSDSGDGVTYDERVEGAFRSDAVVKAPDSGSYQVCAWMEDGNGDTRATGTATLVVRPPDESLAFTGPGSRVAPGKAFTLHTGFTAEVPRILHVGLTRTASCGPSYDALVDAGSSTIRVVDDAPEVSGDGSRDDVVTVDSVGTWRICGFLEDPNDDGPAELAYQSPKPIVVAKRHAGKHCGNVGGRRHIKKIRAMRMNCDPARRVARRWGRARHPHRHVGAFTCTARALHVVCAASRHRRLTFNYRP